MNLSIYNNASAEQFSLSVLNQWIISVSEADWYSNYVFYAGCMHWSRYVCFEGEEGTRDSGGFWDGGGQGDEKGDWKKYVIAEVVEVIFILCFWCTYLVKSDNRITLGFQFTVALVFLLI